MGTSILTGMSRGGLECGWSMEGSGITGNARVCREEMCCSPSTADPTDSCALRNFGSLLLSAGGAWKNTFLRVAADVDLLHPLMAADVPCNLSLLTVSAEMSDFEAVW
ncbi:hypothetical protein L798_01953 [Zootermopsis nevadensis]|uniref:Uncharacterized protein n=1 Tax=Zootermopsis nevadensis TaxID=136037 RepID=A0A067QV56_ZOONE|nr:hypothetical protein L798_01953 [Zootermopsis nevadensis]